MYCVDSPSWTTGYRDDSLETVKRNRDQYGIPLKVLSYEDLYGWTMDKIVAQVGYNRFIIEARPSMESGFTTYNLRL